MASPGAARTAMADAIIAQFRAALRELRCMSGDRLRRTETSPTSLHILSMLDRHGDMAMSRLAEMLDVSLSNGSGLIDRLEERGLVERVRVADDRRVVLVRATEAGRAALQRSDVLKDELVARILTRLDDEGLARLAETIRDVTVAAAEVLASDPELGWHEHLRDQHPTAAPAAPQLPAVPSPVTASQA
jgi:DNA-binding MarR family transcriptional regulator